jgi:hypothetical protein
VAVSPGEVIEERDRLGVVVAELNRRVAAERGCRLSLWRWETDAHPGLHLDGPQGLIDGAMAIEDADVVVGIFWKRFGTPTLGTRSGTEHELRRAWAAWQENGRPQVMVYFCQRPYMPQSTAETAQQQQVLSFREAMPEQQLWWTYTTADDFERAVREHLTAFVLALGPVQKPTAPALRPRRVRFNLPLATAHFTGRSTELDAIDTALGIAGRAVVTQTITGLGGVGKSLLAARYVHEHADEYDIVAWIRAEDGGIADLSELAAELDLPPAQLTPPERAAGALRWLNNHDERWLLVLDNVAAPEQLGECCPRAGNGRVIVTTRHRGMAQFAPELAVDVFGEATAVEYLLLTSGRTDDRDGATRLARALGFLPLALSHAGAYCAAGTTFDDYLELLGALPAAELFDSHAEASYAQTVASTWKVSIDAAERDAPLARQVIAMASYLAPDAMPRELFDVLLGDASTVAGRKHLLDAFNALHRLSVAEVDDAGLSVHRLLQKTIRDDPAVRADETIALRALAAVDAAFPCDHSRSQTWRQSERLLPHVLAIAAALPPSGAAGQRLVALFNRAVDYLIWADAGQRAVDTAMRASACAQRCLGPEHADTLRARSHVAVANRLAGRADVAVELGQRVLADTERILGPEHDATLRARAHVAVSYRAAGRAVDAVELGERVLADSKRILGPEHHATLRVRGNLARSYEAAGRTGDAIALGEGVLADRERILGGEHPETLSSRAQLAVSYRHAGRTREAIELGRHVLVDRERILGPEHPDTLSTRAHLAVACRDAGRTGEAIELGEHVLAERERILGPEHPDTLSVRAVLAVSYRHAGRIGEAIELGEHVLAERERILGLEHPDTIRVRAHVAVAYRAAGRTGEATDLGERVLAESERILGPGHPDTVRARANLAWLLPGHGRPGLSRPMA